MAIAAPIHAQDRTLSGFPAGYLDGAWQYVAWTDVKDLSREEQKAYLALRSGPQEQAKALLLALRAKRPDSVLARKGLLDLASDRRGLRAALAALRENRVASKGHRLSHADELEFGYATAMLYASYPLGNAPKDLSLDAAVDGVRAVLKDSPTVPDLVAAGVILSKIGPLGEAREALEEAARFAPRRPGVQLLRAWSLIHVGSRRNPEKPHEALVCALRAIREDVNRAEAYEMAGDCYVLLGDRKRADAQYREFVRRSDPRSRRVKAVREDLERRAALDAP